MDESEAEASELSVCVSCVEASGDDFHGTLTPSLTASRAAETHKSVGLNG